MHHPPFETGIEWMDGDGLRGGRRLDMEFPAGFTWEKAEAYMQHRYRQMKESEYRRS